jgi:hypothetical protein
MCLSAVPGTYSTTTDFYSHQLKKPDVEAAEKIDSLFIENDISYLYAKLSILYIIDLVYNSNL